MSTTLESENKGIFIQKNELKSIFIAISQQREKINKLRELFSKVRKKDLISSKNKTQKENKHLTAIIKKPQPKGKSRLSFEHFKLGVDEEIEMLKISLLEKNEQILLLKKKLSQSSEENAKLKNSLKKLKTKLKTRKKKDNGVNNINDDNPFIKKVIKNFEQSNESRIEQIRQRLEEEKKNEINNRIQRYKDMLSQKKNVIKDLMKDIEKIKTNVKPLVRTSFLEKIENQQIKPTSKKKTTKKKVKKSQQVKKPKKKKKKFFNFFKKIKIASQMEDLPTSAMPMSNAHSNRGLVEKNKTEKIKLEKRINKLEEVNKIITSQTAFLYGNNKKDLAIHAYLGFVVKSTIVCSQSRNEIQFFEELYSQDREINRIYFPKIPTEKEKSFFIKYFGSWKEKTKLGDKVFKIALERGKFDLKKYIQKANNSSMNFIEKLRIISECVKCVQILHKYKISHNDIKPDNFIMFDKPKDPNSQIRNVLLDFNLDNELKYIVKLLDFENINLFVRKFIKIQGTYNYLDIKLFDLEKNTLDPYSPQRDVYSVCGTMFFILWREIPLRKLMNEIFKHYSSTISPNMIPRLCYSVLINNEKFYLEQEEDEKDFLTVLEEKKGDLEVQTLLDNFKMCKNQKTMYYLINYDHRKRKKRYIPTEIVHILKKGFSFNEIERPKLDRIKREVEKSIRIFNSKRRTRSLIPNYNQNKYRNILHDRKRSKEL